MKPFFMGILFREIGAPNRPSSAISSTKAAWARQDYGDWVRFWNAVNIQEGSPDKRIDFRWADVFPTRTPTVLRCAIGNPEVIPLLYRACWEQNVDAADDSIPVQLLNDGGYNGPDLMRRARQTDVKTQLHELTVQAKKYGICGVPSYRILTQSKTAEWEPVRGIIRGQDELNIVEDTIAGWTDEDFDTLAEVRVATTASQEKLARL